MPRKICCAAIDLGATSGRVIVGKWYGHRIELTEVHRFTNQFRSLGSNDYWDLPGIWQEVRTGLTKARRQFPTLASVGVDTWGVDHVLLDSAGRLVFPVHAYRDGRTQRRLKKLATNPRALRRIYRATGIPNIFYNSSLQLAETLASYPTVGLTAARCLFLSDYFNFLISGRIANEISISSTSQLLSVDQADWSGVALKHFGVPSYWFSEPIKAGTVLGPVIGLPDWRGALAVAVPGHDTASAYASMPADPNGNDLYISCGTWSLIGFEHASPLLSAGALRAQICNERMGNGRFRPLTNIIGLWLLEQILRDLEASPRTEAQWAQLITAARACPAPRDLLNLTDPGLVNPVSMRTAIAQQLRKDKRPAPKSVAAYARLICDSLGRGHADAMCSFSKLSGKKFQRILMVGGGAKNSLLCQATADAAGLPLYAYSIEGSAVGNIAHQLIGLGVVRDITEFRGYYAKQIRPTIYQPC